MAVLDQPVVLDDSAKVPNFVLKRLSLTVPSFPSASMNTGRPSGTMVPRIPAMKVWYWPNGG